MNHKRVARVMRLEGIRGYAKKRRVRTTIPEPSGQKYLDLLKRDFTAERPNRLAMEVSFNTEWGLFRHRSVRELRRCW